jgi:putative endonuclease
MTNKIKTTLYTGVTSDLVKRVYEHKNNTYKGFTSYYKCEYLVYYEIFDDMESAITREKQIKAGTRKKKIDLINSLNPKWNDLYETLF